MRVAPTGVTSPQADATSSATSAASWHGARRMHDVEARGSARERG
jgi:hypothetical protein